MQHDLAEFLGRAQRALDRDGRAQFLLCRTRLAAEAACRHLRILSGDGCVHIGDRQPVAQQFLRVNPYPHGHIGAKELHLANTGHSANLVVDIAYRVVGQPDFVLAAIVALVGQRVDQQKAGAGLLDLQAHLHHGGGQACFGFLDAVLHFHLSECGVGARRERGRDFSQPRGAAGRIEIEQALGAIELFLDDAGDRLHDRGGRRPRIGCRDGNLRRSDVRKLRHRQHRNRQQSAEQDEDRHDPGKLGAINEEPGHCLSLYRAGILFSQHSACRGFLLNFL